MASLHCRSLARLYKPALYSPEVIRQSSVQHFSQLSQLRSAKSGSGARAMDEMQSTEDQATSITRKGLTEQPPSSQPDYNAPIDHGTSSFSPIPRRVMDGSESDEILPAAVISGAPVDLQARQVRIFRPAKTATQSGTWHAHHWRMDWDILQKGHRWENPLMGWQSSGDSMQGTHLNFKSKEEAIQFAQKQGYEYFVQEPNEKRIVPKAYANNFVHEPKPLKYIKTK